MVEVDVVVVGAGFAGLRSLYTLRGLGLDVVVLEAGDDIGGVWQWNRYPGARCDVESYDYSYGFSEELEQEWRWSERYATQPEILSYIHHVAERFDLRRDVRLEEEVVAATWEESGERWRVTTRAGSEFASRFLIMATGQLSTTKTPSLPGQDDFQGEVLMTARWPREGVDLRGKRVGVIGTGSSGMQLIPVVAQEAEHLVVFQRTPNFSVPATNGPISDERDAEVKASYAARREASRNSPSGLGSIPISRTSALEVSEEERRERYEEFWTTAGFGFALVYYDILRDQEANDTAADFIREKIGAKVRDPAVREALMPRDFPFAAKRPSVDSGYYETFNRENVELVDIREQPLEALTASGIRTSRADYPLDVVVFATGFDALTGSLLRPDIRGRDGLSLREKWAAGPVTHLGLGVSGFPNLFIIAGPGSPSLLSNVLLSTEQHVDWIADLLEHVRERGISTVEVTEEAEQEWVAHVNEKSEETLYPRAASYYMGDEVAGKPHVFMPYSGGVRGYRRILEKVVADGYAGFELAGRDRSPAQT